MTDGTSKLREIFTHDSKVIINPCHYPRFPVFNPFKPPFLCKMASQTAFLSPIPIGR